MVLVTAEDMRRRRIPPKHNDSVHLYPTPLEATLLFQVEFTRTDFWPAVVRKH